MITEILGFLIIFGALLILIVRYHTRKQEQPLLDQHEMREATAQLKQELQKTGDEVVGRLSDRVTQLESLLQQAEEKQAALSAKVDESRRLENELTLQGEELKALRQQLAALQATATLAASLPQRSMPPATEPETPGTGLAGDPAAPAAAAAEPAAVHAPEAPTSAADGDAQDFAAILQQSIEREHEAAETAPEPPVSASSLGQYQTYADSVQAAGLAAAMQDGTVDETAAPPEAAASPDGQPSGSAAAKARALLMSGYSVEDTARETGLGQGAVMLVREMNRRELEKA